MYVKFDLKGNVLGTTDYCGRVLKTVRSGIYLCSDLRIYVACSGYVSYLGNNLIQNVGDTHFFYLSNGQVQEMAGTYVRYYGNGYIQNIGDAYFRYLGDGSLESVGGDRIYY